MSKSEFKTEREHQTSSKYKGSSGYKTSSKEPFKKEESEISESDIDKMKAKDLQSLKRQLGVKTKAKSKVGLKKAINNHLSKDKKVTTPKPQEKPFTLKTPDEMSVAELRVLAPRYGVKSGGIEQKVLVARIKKAQSELDDTNENLQNLPSGSSITTAFYDGDKMDSDYDVSIIDKDVEPHKEAKILDQGKGVYLIEQTTVLGEQEVTAVTITDSEQGMKNKHRLAELEKQVKSTQGSKEHHDLPTSNYIENRDEIIQLKDNFRSAKFQQEEYRKRKEWNQEGEGEMYAKEELKNKEWAKESEIAIHSLGGHTSWYEMDKQELSDEMVSYRTVKLLKEEADKQKVLKSDDKRIRNRKKLEEKILSNIVQKQPYLDSIELDSETQIQALTQSKFETEMETQIVSPDPKQKGSSKIPNRFSLSDNIIEPQKYADFPKGSAWKEARIIHEKRRKEYQKKDLVPILHPIRGKKKVGNKQPGNEVVDIKELKKIPKVDILHEKGYPQLDEHKNDSLLSTGGQNLQNVYSDNLEYKGVFFQDSTHEEPINHFAVANEIWVDSDDAGHYIGYMNNLFTRTDKKGNPDPFYPNVRFKTKDGFTTPKAVTEHQAMRFWVGNHIDSAGYRRNLVLSAPVVRQLVGKKALSYRSAQGKNVTFKLSEQKLAICNAIYNPKKLIIIKTADIPSGISFPFIAHDIMIKPEDKPILAFTRNKEQELTRLTSDDMIKIMVDTMQLEPDQAQSTLEALYQAEWINYPRSDTTKAEHEHIYLLKDINKFEGTNIEKQTLQIIKDSETAYKSGSNYKDNGTWKLMNKKTVLVSTKGYKLPYMKKEYTKDEFDITIQSKGINSSDLTQFISDNEIGTPATRMTQFAELKEAGIVKKIGDVYVVDKRGLILSATYDYYNENSWSVINLKQQLKDEESVDRMIDLLGFIQPLTKEEKNKAIKEIKAVSKELIEGEKDIATLDGF